MSNEARCIFQCDGDFDHSGLHYKFYDGTHEIGDLAAERKATVERIRAALGEYFVWNDVYAILDAEAAR